MEPVLGVGHGAAAVLEQVIDRRIARGTLTGKIRV
jgi:hypothetical protein